jgi:citrate lyase beta subunit
MRHYKHIPDDQIDNLFYIEPKYFDKNSDISILKYALGATLYIPSTKDNIHEMLLTVKYPALTSIVLCLEDAISIEQTSDALQNIIEFFSQLNKSSSENSSILKDLPLIFIRIREYSQLEHLLEFPLVRYFTCGFILPKFDAAVGGKCLSLIDETNKKFTCTLYALPLIESLRVINQQTRVNELALIKSCLNAYKHLILNIRIGGTDFSGYFGLRRSTELSIYDIFVVSHCISDIINFFSIDNADNIDYVISGPVWEHFSSITDTQKIISMKKQSTLPADYGSVGFKAVDGLLKEISLDKANGLVGKTIIHPSQITFVNAMQAVTYEEYCDAKNILLAVNGGAIKSEYNNKMNEISPHFKWAQKIMRRTEVYGVLKADECCTNLF